MVLKTPKIAYTSKLQQFLKSPSIRSMPYKNYTKQDDILKYQLSRSEYNDKVNKLLKPEQNYLVSGKIKNKILKNGSVLRSTNYKRSYSFRFKAKANLTNSELETVIFNKLREYYSVPRDGNSSNNITGFSYNLFETPANYKYHHNVRLFNIKAIESKLMSKYSQKLNITYNCVIDYIAHELQKINKKVNKELIIKRMSEFSNIQDGISIKAFEKYMSQYHKKIKYIILSPYFDCIKKYEPNYRYNLTLTFYCNNKHLYPIQELSVQSYISEMLTKNKNYNFFKYFQEQEITKYNDFKYMDDINDEKHEEDKTYILNSDLDINNFCQDLINKYQHQPDFININYNTSSIQSFKHPTKNIIYEAYDDYHKRKIICEKINKMFNNEFINFKNESYGVISKTLINFLDDITPSDYIEETYNYLEEYEPKPINETLKDCNKDDIYQLDYYKQYSSIFYLDFEKYDIKIPIYDFFNTVEDFDNKNNKLEIGEYYIEQINYKGFKLFGCFIHYKIVEILLKKNIITKENIKKQITTTKYFNPECFKKFVEITSKLGETEFKKLNNILNGVLKDSKIRKSTDYFTNDINTLCYIYNKSIQNDNKIKWLYDEKTNYHFIKETKNIKKLSNTSSFYRTTLSCSILQTINLLDEADKYGEVVKILTDAVYYKPYKFELIKTDDKDENIIKNLGKYFYDLTDDIYIHEAPDKEFIKKDIIKKSTFIKGSGGLGKTYSVIEKLNNDDDKEKKILFTSFTNDACQNLQDNINKIIGYVPKNWKINTLSRVYLVDNNINKYELIIIDEAITTPNRFLKRLEQNDIKKIYMGDEHQMHQIFNIYQQEVNLMNYFNKYCNIEIKNFVEGKARYNKETYNFLENFKKTGKTKEFNKISDIKPNKIYKCNIAYTNKKVVEINNKCCEKYNKDGEYFTFELKKENYDLEEEEKEEQKTGKKYKYKIGLNTPLRCETNNKDLFKMYGITTAWRGKIKDINEKSISLKGIIIENDKFIKKVIDIDKDIIKSHFTVSYCMTAHKWQGQTIKKKFAIYETDYYIKYLSRNFLYTAMSRTGKLENIYIDKQKIHKFYHSWKPTKKYILTNHKKEAYNIYITKEGLYTSKKNNNFFKQVICTKNYLKIIIDNLNYNYDKKIKIETVKKMIFKPLLTQNKKTVINIYENKIKCLYYDENEQPKYKEVYVSKKKNIKDCFNIVLKDYPEAIIKDKKNILCF